MEFDMPEPVSPAAMEISFIYVCPACRKSLRVINPVKDLVLTCPQCHQEFPIVPVRQEYLTFFRFMTADGKAITKY